MRYSILFLFLSSLFFISCADDGGISGNDVLHYDGDNATAPTLPAGSYEFAIRFPSLITRNVIDKNITEVSFYLYEIPSSLIITFSPDNTALNPGNILYGQEVTSLKANSWNTVRLDQPFGIDGSALWIGIQVVHADAIQSVGCDAGPANANGDWLYDETDKLWLTFRSRVGDSINWNIRVKTAAF